MLFRSDAGWLGAATAMARRDEDDAPHLIYTPEIVFDRERFLWDVENIVNTIGWVSVVCGEGIKYSDGTPVSEAVARDKFNNTEFGAMGGASAGISLHRMITDKLGYRGEFQITESLIMSDYVRASQIDAAEAWQCGVEAVKIAEAEESGFMVSIERLSDDPYEICYSKVPLENVAVSAKPMPPEYFNEEGNYVSQAFLNYIKPLTGELPEFTRLKKIMNKK